MTKIQFYQDLNQILSSVERGYVFPNSAMLEIRALQKEAEKAGLDLNVNITLEELEEFDNAAEGSDPEVSS